MGPSGRTLATSVEIRSGTEYPIHSSEAVHDNGRFSVWLYLSHLGAVSVSQINDMMIVRDSDGRNHNPNNLRTWCVESPYRRYVAIIYNGYAINRTLILHIQCHSTIIHSIMLSMSITASAFFAPMGLNRHSTM